MMIKLKTKPKNQKNNYKLITRAYCSTKHRSPQSRQERLWRQGKGPRAEGD